MFLTVCLSVNKPKRGTGDMFCTVADSIMAAVCLFVCLFCSADSATIARCGRRCVVRTKMQVEFEDRYCTGLTIVTLTLAVLQYSAVIVEDH